MTWRVDKGDQHLAWRLLERQRGNPHRAIIVNHDGLAIVAHNYTTHRTAATTITITITTSSSLSRSQPRCQLRQHPSLYCRKSINYQPSIHEIQSANPIDITPRRGN